MSSLVFYVEHAILLLMNSIPLHDPKCKLCKPALAAIKRCQRQQYRAGQPVKAIEIRLSPDFNAFGVFMGFHVSLVK